MSFYGSFSSPSLNVLWGWVRGFSSKAVVAEGQTKCPSFSTDPTVWQALLLWKQDNSGPHLGILFACLLATVFSEGHINTWFVCSASWKFVSRIPAPCRGTRENLFFPIFQPTHPKVLPFDPEPFILTACEWSSFTTLWKSSLAQM